MNPLRKVTIGIIAAALATVGAGVVLAQSDNSKVNKMEKMDNTADGQKNNKSDIQITADIRKAVVAEKSFSTYAHNVKIVTKHGAVMLKGPVRTEEEKSSVEAKAKEVAGADKVTSQITVVPEKKGKTAKSAS